MTKQQRYLLNHPEKRNPDRHIYCRQYNQTHKVERRNYTESSFRTFLVKVLNRLRNQDRARNREYNININYVLKIGESQNWKCAITSEQMVHKFNNLRTISVDRIRPSKGHVKGNIQLVCKFVNLGKNNHSDFEIRSLIQSIRNNQTSNLIQSTGT